MVTVLLTGENPYLTSGMSFMAAEVWGRELSRGRRQITIDPESHYPATWAFSARRVRAAPGQ
jgi:hypothetical protein